MTNEKGRNESLLSLMFINENKEIIYVNPIPKKAERAGIPQNCRYGASILPSATNITKAANEIP